MSEMNMTKGPYDKVGILFSIACLLHCLALPFLAYIAPSITVFLEQEWIHLLLLICLIPIALFSFVKGKNIHQQNLPLISGGIGVLFLILALLFEEFKPMDLESIFTFLGSSFLIFAHIKNMNLLNKITAN